MTSLLQGIDQVTADDIAINKHDQKIVKTKDAQLTSLFAWQARLACLHGDSYWKNKT